MKISKTKWRNKTLNILMSFILIGVALVLYSIIVGANRNKTEKERFEEDKEQMRDLEKYKKKF